MAWQDIYNSTYLITFFFFALFETLLCSGITYGWASIVVVFKSEHFFLGLCDNKTETSLRSSDISFLDLTARDVFGPRFGAFSKDDSLPGCAKQDDMFNLIFTVSLFCLCGIKFPAGIFVDRCGPRVARLVGGIVYLAASLGLGFVAVGYENVLFPVFGGIAIGGSILVVAVYQVSNIIFRNARSRVLCILHGAFDSSSVCLLLFKIIYESGVNFRLIMYGYSGLSFLFIFFGTLVLIPPMQKLINWGEEECEVTARIHNHSAAGPDFVVRSMVCRDGGRGFVASAANVKPETPIPKTPISCPSSPYTEYNAYDTDDEASDIDEEDTSEHKVLTRAHQSSSMFPRGSVLRSIFTPLYLLELIFLLTFQLKLWYFVGSLPDYLTRLTNNNKDQVSYYINLFGYIQFGGMLVTPVLGFIFDRAELMGYTDQITTPAERRVESLRGCITPFFITNILCLAFCTMGLFNKLYLQIPCYILYTIVRGFLYGNHGAYMGRAFPASQFGTLYGLGIFIGGTFGVLQYALFNLTNKVLNGNPFYTNMILLILVAIGLLHPLYLWWYCRKETKRLRGRSFHKRHEEHKTNNGK